MYYTIFYFTLDIVKCQNSLNFSCNCDSGPQFKTIVVCCLVVGIRKLTSHACVDDACAIILMHAEVAKLNANEWYFFSFRDRKYATGFRTNRATTSGYWKATGKDRKVEDPATQEVVGMRKTLVFYRNRAPNGIKTGWIMHEFRLETPHMPPKVRSFLSTLLVGCNLFSCLISLLSI